MKKVSVVIALLLAVAVIAVCVLRMKGQDASAAAESAAVQNTPADSAAALPNPVRASSMEELDELFGIELKAPEGAHDVVYSRVETEPQIGQMDFTHDGISCSCRVSAGCTTTGRRISSTPSAA